MNNDLPRSLKLVTVWLLVGAVVFLAIQWWQHRAQQTRFQVSAGTLEIRRSDDGHYHWPGRINGRQVDFLIDTGATGTAIPASLADDLKLESLGTVRSSTAGGVVTGQVVRADIELQGGVKVERLQSWRCRSSATARCSAWTCSANCTGSSATACCASRSRTRAEMPMKESFRATLAAVLIAALCAGAQAQAPAECPPTAKEPSPEQVKAALRDARDHGFLWRISKDGRSSWLFGTLHVATFEWAFPGPAQREALAQSDTLALEIDLTDPLMQQRMEKALADQPKTPLPAALQARIDQRAQSDCLPPQALAAFAPEMQVAVLATQAARRDGLDAAYGIDNFLAGWGRASKMDMVSLETPESQLKILQMKTPQETHELVEGTLDELDSGRARATMRRLATIWADGNLPELLAYEAWCECVKTAADRAAMARMLDERNPALADAIAELHAVGQRVFAAVGSLHMIGPTGLPAQMARRGYRVERIDFNPQKPPETTP